MLETRTLRYFVVVAEELHFGRAAARLNIVQPALSAQIKSLETRLGTTLLVRNRQNVALSPVGRAFLDEARKALAQIEQTEAIGRQAASGAIGLLRVGYVGSVPFGGWLPRAVSSFSLTYPAVEIRLEELGGPAQIERLQSGTLDAGFVRLPLPSQPPNLVLANRTGERMMVALPSRHPLASRRSIDPADLSDQMFIVASAQEHAGLSALFWRICTDGGFTPHIAQTTPHIATVISLVGVGLGVALLPESISSFRSDDTVYRPLNGDDYITEVAMVVRKVGGSPILQNFLKAVEAARSPPSDNGTGL